MGYIRNLTDNNIIFSISFIYLFLLMPMWLARSYISYQEVATFCASQVALVVENLPASAGDARDMGSIPGSGRSPGVGNGNPLQYF